MVRHMGWVVWRKIDAEVLWCVVAPLRQLIVGHVVVSLSWDLFVILLLLIS